MGFKRNFSTKHRTNRTLIERGLIELTSAHRQNTDKAGKVTRFVTNTYKMDVNDAAECSIRTGDVVDLLIDPVERIGCFQRCTKGRKVTGKTVLSVAAAWSPEDPCVANKTVMKVLRGSHSNGVPLPEGLCFQFPPEVSFSTRCIIEDDNVAHFNERYGRNK